MAFFLALIYFILCILNLIHYIFLEKTPNNLETLIVIGVISIGMYLSWTVMKGSLKK